MNSIHRLGLTIASVATVATVAGAFVVQGYVSAEQAAAQANAQVADQAAAALTPQIVYISPVALAATAPSAGSPPVIHVIVPGGGDDGGSNY